MESAIPVIPNHKLNFFKEEHPEVYWLNIILEKGCRGCKMIYEKAKLKALSS